jgi:hypothetical protein
MDMEMDMDMDKAMEIEMDMDKGMVMDMDTLGIDMDMDMEMEMEHKTTEFISKTGTPTFPVFGQSGTGLKNYRCRTSLALRSGIFFICKGQSSRTHPAPE